MVQYKQRGIMKSRSYRTQQGFTVVEMLVASAVLAIMSIGLVTLYGSLVTSTNFTKRKAVAITIATNQMEYLKSLPFDSLAISGGAIYSANPLPSTTIKTINGVAYTVVSSINYVDDSFDGCASYATLALKQAYCRNYPPPTGAPTTDSNPQDYKIIHISVTTAKNSKLAEVDSQVSARVAETASSTGALYVTVIDATGNPITGATVNVVNATVTPAVNVNDSTDSLGNAIFYGLRPDTTNYDYTITASKIGYSTLTTIVPTGTLQPNYSNKQIFTQQSSVLTLVLLPQGTNSLWAEAVNTSGASISGLKMYVKGGYKKYNSVTDTKYYYDNMSPSDTRPTTDSGGNAVFTNLVPLNYIFCGDLGSTSCTVGATKYYLVAAVPDGGINSLNPITVPTYSSSSPPSVTYTYNGVNYLQHVKLIFSTSSSFPRVFTITPSDLSIAAGGLSAFAFQLTGVNLPCSATASSCTTSVKLVNGSDSRTASCVGNSSGLQLSCTVNMTGVDTGMSTLTITSGSNVLTLPGSPLQGGINVLP